MQFSAWWEDTHYVQLSAKTCPTFLHKVYNRHGGHVTICSVTRTAQGRSVPGARIRLLSDSVSYVQVVCMILIVRIILLCS